METPEQTRINKENKKRIKSGKVKEPRKKYAFYIPELRAEIRTNNKDEQEIRNKYLHRVPVNRF